MSGNRNQLTIRPACVEDVPAIAVLCEQLGYPVSQRDVRRRLTDEAMQSSDHVIYVVEAPDGCVVGWVHTYVCRLVVRNRYAEIGGLVVEKDYRGRGIGRLLMDRVEHWARERECSEVRLRSNVIREGAHRFYEEIGYANVKASYTFRKMLQE